MQIREALSAIETRGVHVRYLQTRERPGGWIKRSVVLSAVWFLFQFTRGAVAGDDVLVVDYSGRLQTLLLVIAVKCTRRARIAIVIQSINFAYRTSQLKNALDRLVSRVFLRTGDVVISSGRTLSEEVMLLGVPENRLRIVYPALRAEFKKYVGLSKASPRDGKIRLLWVGRVHPIKGLEYLVQAMVPFRGMDNVRLVLVGDDKLVPWYSQKIARLIEESGLQHQTEWRGRIDTVEELALMYAGADIFVLPSLWDTSPIVVIEAMCFGLPVIGTLSGGVREWIQDGESGFLVKAGDATTLQTAIAALITNTALRERMGLNSLRASRRHQDRTWEQVGMEYYEAVISLLKHGKIA